VLIFLQSKPGGTYTPPGFVLTGLLSTLSKRRAKTPAGVIRSLETKVAMSSRTSAQARAQTVPGSAFLVVAGLVMVLSAMAMRGHGLRVSQLDSLPLTRIVTQAVAPKATTTPSIFDAETAMGPRALVARWDPLIAEASRRFKVPEKWIRAVMRMESGGRTVLQGDMPITSNAGAVGIMQVMPGTYAEMRQQYRLGDNPFDPRDNILAGAAYLRWLHGKYGYPAMFAAYNNGPGNLEAHLNKGRKLPAETRNYIAGISKILGTATAAAKAKFTRPDGTPVWIDTATVSGLRAVLPGEFDDNVRAVLNIGTTRQAVCEDLATVAALLRGGSV